MDTSSYVVVEKKLNDIIKEFDTSVGTELVEIVRTKLACPLLLNFIRPNKVKNMLLVLVPGHFCQV